MNSLQWTALIVAASTVYVYVAFMGLCTAKRMRAAVKRAGLKLPWDLRVVCWALLIGGGPADVVYNMTVGSWRFRFQGPFLATYSKRVQWHVDHLEDSKNGAAAVLWFVILNAGDPGHVDPPTTPHTIYVEGVDTVFSPDTLRAILAALVTPTT